jgi:hypothetical protein
VLIVFQKLANFALINSHSGSGWELLV